MATLRPLVASNGLVSLNSATADSGEGQSRESDREKGELIELELGALDGAAEGKQVQVGLDRFGRRQIEWSDCFVQLCSRAIDRTCKEEQ